VYATFDINMTAQKIFLFDMDGVLLEPRGYHKALRETVRLLGEALGYSGVALSPDDIAAFEAAGITSEWDSSAICSVLLILPLWERFPTLRLPANLKPDRRLRHALPPPSWDSFFDSLNQLRSESADPMLRVAQLLGSGNDHKEAIEQILSHAHDVHESITHRIFQELVLGSDVFNQTYQLPAWFETESYLRRFDRPALSHAQRDALLAWLERDEHRAAIVTNRPSLPPEGFGTPEAEIGAEGVGLDQFPLVGYGDMLWLSASRDVDVLRLRKPSPVHVLAALLRGAGLQPEAALHHAADLALSGTAMPLWQEFSGAEVTMFEDTTAGLKSALAAKVVLEQAGVAIDLRLVGISEAASKRSALEGVGAQVYPSLGLALHSLM
jgi:phosphoglycolate phosphatase-like HAD superfamily hydrolase